MTDVLPGTQPIPLCAPAEPLTGESHAHLLEPLERLAGEVGYQVQYRPIDGSTGGWCDTRQREIIVDDQLPANAKVRVLVHEIAHSLGVGYTEYGRAQAEVLVDTVTYVVLSGQVGLDVGGESIPYSEAPEKRYGGRVFRVGDKVTQLRNNYHKGQAGIFNGTVGVVTGLSLEEQTLTVLADEDEHIEYEFGELDELAHAYAITIHRSQGSEYHAVVIPLTTSSWLMLQRNLLYTGVTRAKQLIVLAGSRRALAQAVRTPGAGRRHTALTHRLHPTQ
jgi:exodeoxyribonuclease V alpha subunit